MRVGQPGGAELVAEQPLDDQGEAEGQQQAVEVVELVEPLEHRPLEHDAEQPDHERRQEQRPPVAEPGVLQQELGDEGAHHVLGAVGEVDDVEQAEDDREPEAQQGVERAVDQPDQELAEQRLGRDAEELDMGSIPSVTVKGTALRPPPVRRRGASGSGYFFTSGQSPWSSGRKASSAGMVARSL